MSNAYEDLSSCLNDICINLVSSHTSHFHESIWQTNPALCLESHIIQVLGPYQFELVKLQQLSHDYAKDYVCYVLSKTLARPEAEPPHVISPGLVFTPMLVVYTRKRLREVAYLIFVTHVSVRVEFRSIFPIRIIDVDCKCVNDNISLCVEIYVSLWKIKLFDGTRTHTFMGMR